MNRRGFLQRLVGGAAVAAAAIPFGTPPLRATLDAKPDDTLHVTSVSSGDRWYRVRLVHSYESGADTVSWVVLGPSEGA